MLKNKKPVYFCQECGYESAKWMGQCPGCKSWNTFVEETVSTKKPSSSGAMKSSEKRQEPVILKDISLSEDERQTTQIGELDRVLGGGIVPGSLVLVGGDPGIGKSTLLLQVCRNLAEKQVSVLYISGEESLRQIKLRANRIGQFTDKMQLLCETNLEVIRECSKSFRKTCRNASGRDSGMFPERSVFPGKTSDRRREETYECTFDLFGSVQLLLSN